MSSFWRHEACLDLYGHMTTKFHGPYYIKVRATWFVRGYAIGLVQNIKIMRSEQHRWHRCNFDGIVK